MKQTVDKDVKQFAGWFESDLWEVEQSLNNADLMESRAEVKYLRRLLDSKRVRMEVVDNFLDHVRDNVARLSKLASSRSLLDSDLVVALKTMAMDDNLRGSASHLLRALGEPHETKEEISSEDEP